jgi:tRNA A37 threonylcarbamoyladenosine biosynthesis protein TsaE
MNEKASILIASIFLAIGGAGLYLYKTSNKDVEYNVHELFNDDNVICIENDIEDKTPDEPLKENITTSKKKKNKKNSVTKKRH